MARKQAGTLEMGYLELRKASGWIGLAFPFILIAGGWICQAIRNEPLHLESQISQYYYNGMGDIFVGLLCALGVFHLATEGYEFGDLIAGRLACVFGFGVAWLPTIREGSTASPMQHLVADLHYVCAGLLFGTLAFLCIFQFTKTDDKRKRTNRKKMRNVVYYVCGGIITGCIVLIGSVNLIESRHVLTAFTDWLKSWKWQFCFESIALLAFGAAFLVKGELMLKDVVHPGNAKKVSQK
jgi:hypothetical protein